MVLVVVTVSCLCAIQVLPFLKLVGQSHRVEGWDAGKWAMPTWGWANYFFRYPVMFLLIPNLLLPILAAFELRKLENEISVKDPGFRRILPWTGVLSGVGLLVILLGTWGYLNPVENEIKLKTLMNALGRLGKLR